MRIQNRGSRLLFVTLLLLTVATSASAYVDPGTGSAVIQIAIAAAVSAAFALKSYWRAVVGFIANVLGGKRRA